MLPENINFWRKRMNYSEEEKILWLEDWQNSGKGALDYARNNGLIPQTFTGWTSNRTKRKIDFIESRPAVYTAIQTVLRRKGGYKTRISACLRQCRITRFH